MHRLAKVFICICFLLIVNQVNAYQKKYFIAVAIRYPNAFVYLSRDTLHWDVIPFPDPHPQDVIWANGQYLVLTREGKIYVSENAKDWELKKTDLDNITTIRWLNDNYIAYSSTAGKAGIYTSPDGMHFSLRLKEDASIRDFASDGRIVVGVGRDWQIGGQGVIATSSDLIHWQVLRTKGTRMRSVIWANKQFVAVGTVAEDSENNNDGRMMISHDGFHWKKIKNHVDGNSFQYELVSIAYGNGRYVVAGNGSGEFQWSIDGKHWTIAIGDLETFLRKIIFVDGKFVSVGDSSGSIWTSRDGIFWTLSYISHEDFLSVA